MNALELSAPSISEPESQASQAPGLDPDVVLEQTSPPPFSVVESALRLVVGSTLIGGRSWPGVCRCGSRRPWRRTVR